MESYQGRITELYYRIILWNHVTHFCYGCISRNYIMEIFYSRHIMADTLLLTSYSSYIAVNILWQICFGRYITADVLREIYYRIYYCRYMIAEILRPLYSSRYMTADILRQIHPSRYIAHNKNNHVSTNVQRRKLSIAASESLCCNASPQRAQGPPRQP